MKNNVVWTVLVMMVLTGVAMGQQEGEKENEKCSWYGKYPMSMFTKTRSAKTVGKGKISFSLKTQYFNSDQKKQAGGGYNSLSYGQSREIWKNTFCTKYGWAKDHHLAVGIPYIYNDFELSTDNHSHGIGNIFIFEKWNFMKETETMPAAAVDIWYYLPTGDTKRKLGSDDASYKITAELSKAIGEFSFHFNPGYTWSQDKDAEVGELNAGIIWHGDPKIWPAVEWNYTDKEEKGFAHDIVPGVIWRFAKGWSFKIALPINVDSTMTYRERVGIVTKLFYCF